MPVKKGNGKKSGFSLAPITLSEPVKTTDGFTNLVDAPAAKEEASIVEQGSDSVIDNSAVDKKTESKREVTAEAETAKPKSARSNGANVEQSPTKDAKRSENSEKPAENVSLTEAELLRILDAESLDEIYELTDVLRASSLKLYVTLVRLADSRGRTRVKNHELMSKSGIKGIATLYKQERWLMDLKLLEKKAKPGPHDGSSYVVHKLESLPLPAEIYEKFEDYLSSLK
jgi:hypothetical protein